MDRLYELRAAYVLITSILLAGTPLVQAMDSLSIEAGSGNATAFYQLAAQQGWSNDWAWLNENQLHTRWEMSVAEMAGKKFNNIEGQTQKLIDFGLTPSLRWGGKSSLGAYAEAGIGIHYLTEKYNNNGRAMGGNFQFGDYIGAGYLFNSHFDVTVKFEHFSDAGIRKPNPAINFAIVKLAYVF